MPIAGKVASKKKTVAHKKFDKRNAMWTRDTFHNYAMELRQISDNFRCTFAKASTLERKQGNPDLIRYSCEGLFLLRNIALAVRSEQDYLLIPEQKQIIGALLKPAHCKFEDFKESYDPPFGRQEGFKPMALREGLNKIAHTDPSRTGFRASAKIHEIIIGGNQGAKGWIAVISIPHLCDVIKKLPDHKV